MSCLILCSGKRAEKPYYFEYTDTKVYSIEELSYYIFNNIYIINREIFTQEMADWINDELKMEKLSNKMREMIKNNNKMKDIVVTILCSSDYYNESEIKELIVTIDKIDGMPVIMRKKLKADNYLKYKNYSMAAKEYDAILSSREIKTASEEEYGNILHNLAIVRLHTSSFSSAATCFKQAYRLNKNIESLKQYLYTLKLDNQESLFEKEVLNEKLSTNVVAEIVTRYMELKEEAKTSSKYIIIDRLEYVKNEGRVNEYYDMIDRQILQWKNDYKRKRSLQNGNI